METNALQRRVAHVLDAFGFTAPQAVTRLSGTATEVVLAKGSFGQIVVRWRAMESGTVEALRFQHACLKRLADAGLPVPRPYSARDGSTWLCDGKQTAEALSWISGAPFQEGDMSAIGDLGRTLARFHAALAVDPPLGKRNVVREDHPDFLQPYVHELYALCNDACQRQRTAQIEAQLDLVRCALDSGLYERLPKAVIHGDIHPGNVAFESSRVAALYDFDYMSRQARVRDLCDALMFFGATRDEPVSANDIRSLTQPFRLQADLCRPLIDGYQSITPLSDLERHGLVLLFRSQWCQIRLRGGRKIAPHERLDFVLSRFSEMIERLDRLDPAFFQLSDN